jgi:hypothetical protein
VYCYGESVLSRVKSTAEGDWRRRNSHDLGGDCEGNKPIVTGNQFCSEWILSLSCKRVKEYVKSSLDYYFHIPPIYVDVILFKTLVNSVYHFR